MIPLVFLHGWGMSPNVFDALSTRFSAYRVEALALPGYGGSAPCEPYTVRHLAARVAAAAPEPCFVAGWSLGGLVALAWAAAHPRQVARLVLLGTSPCFVHRPDWHAAIDARQLQAFSVELTRERKMVLGRFALLQAHGDAGGKRVVQHLTQALSISESVSIDTLDQGLRVLVDSDLRASLPSIEQRCLVIHGEHDALIPRAAAEYLAHALPHGRLTVVPGTGHAPFISSAGEVSRTMLEFFDER